MATLSLLVLSPNKAASFLTFPQLWGIMGYPLYGQSCFTKAGRLSQLPYKKVMPKFSSETWDRLLLSLIPVVLGYSALPHCLYQNKIFSCICILNRCWHISQIFPLWPTEQEFDLQTDYSENTLHAFFALFEMVPRGHCFPFSLHQGKLLFSVATCQAPWDNINILPEILLLFRLLPFVLCLSLSL